MEQSTPCAIIAAPVTGASTCAMFEPYRPEAQVLSAEQVERIQRALDTIHNMLYFIEDTMLGVRGPTA